MVDARKAFKPGVAEKIFDRLTVLLMNDELLLNGTYGPLTAEQKKILGEQVARSKDVAALLREMTDS
jgi:hypothetical protein